MALSRHWTRPCALWFIMPSFIIKIDGENVYPKTVELRHLLETLTRLRKAISAAAIDAGESPNDVFLSLTEISDKGSSLLTIDESDAASVGTSRVSQALRDGDLSLIPKPSRDELHKVWLRAKHNKWTISMHNSTPAAVIDPTRPFPATAQVRGSTSLFVYVIRAGGERSPHVLVRLPNGDKRTFSVNGKALASQLGSKLYRRVVIHGDAKWFVSTRKLAEFKVTRLGSYDDQAADPGATLLSLSDAMGRHWQGVDPEEYLRDERSGDDQ